MPGLRACRVAMVTIELDDLERQLRSFELGLMGQGFIDFLDHVYILEPPPGLSVIKFAKWPHLVELARQLVLHRLITILKARQIGVSWLLAAYALWIVLFQRAAVVVLISKGQTEAADLLGKAKFIHANLPAWMQARVGLDSGSQFTLPTLYSKITALPSTEHAGRSETATLVIQDEADYHEHLDANFTAIKPTIDAGGQLIQASTSNKMKMLSLFKQLYRDSPTNGWVKVFVPWYARPGRDQAWFQRTKESVPTTGYLSPELYMEQEYPASEEEALAPSRAAAFFDPDRCREMLDDCEDPKALELGGAIRIWKPPVIAGRYIAGGDLSWGESGAYSCMPIADWQTGEQVAEIYGRLGEAEMAKNAVELCGRYNKAYVGVEVNGEGRLVVNKMVELGYGDRMFWQDWHMPVPKKPGWYTGSDSRPVMLGELNEAVNYRSVRPRCREAIGEFMSFIRGPDGKPKHSEGAYDDHVMAWAILWQMKHHAKFNTGAVVPVRRKW